MTTRYYIDHTNDLVWEEDNCLYSTSTHIPSKIMRWRHITLFDCRLVKEVTEQEALAIMMKASAVESVTWN